MHDELREVTDDSFQQEIMENEGFILVDFYADWCNPCKLLNKTIKELSEEYADKMKVYKANVDDTSQILSKFKIKGVPAVLMFRNGELVSQHVGLRSKKDLRRDLEVIFNGQEQKNIL